MIGKKENIDNNVYEKYASVSSFRLTENEIFERLARTVTLFKLI